MAYIVKLPQLGLEMEEGTLLEWMVAEGDAVEKGQSIAEIESDKSVGEVEAREDGVLRETYIQEGQTADTGTPMGIVAPPDADISDLKQEVENELDEANSEAGAETEDSSATGSGETRDAGATAEAQKSKSADAVKATPGAKKRAEELGVDLSTVEGTGLQGSITDEDVENAAETADTGDSPTDAVKATPGAKKRAEELGVDLSTVEGTGLQGSITDEDVENAAETADTGDPTDGVEHRELSGMRRTIADRLVQSYREVPHVTLHRTADADKLVAAAEAASELLDSNISVSDVLIQGVSETLSEHPEFNGTFEEGVHKVHTSQDVCVAVDVDEGLVTPAIRSVETLSVAEIAAERKRVTELALEGDYTSKDLRGGTFTVSNLGPLGVESFNPIINPPQIAILGINSLNRQVVPGDHDEPEIRPMLPLDLSFDHRIVDGADAARFLATLVEHLEEPWELFENVSSD